MQFLIGFLIISAAAAAAVFLGGVGMVAYVLPKSMAKFGTASSYDKTTAAIKNAQQGVNDPVYNEWTLMYGTMYGPMTNNQFTFPGQGGSANYVLKSMAVSLGQKITMTFTLEGDGVLVPTEREPPPRVRLYLQRKGDNLSGTGAYEHYRWWSNPANVDLSKPGEFTLSVDAAPEGGWTSVYGKKATDNVTAFQACLQNLAYAGFTFGGVFFGHGVYCQSGSSKFTLKSYNIA